MTPCSSPCQWALDFPGFMAQPRTAFKRDIPLRQRDDWEEWLASR